MVTLRSTEIKVGLVSLGAILLLILGITFGRGLSVSVSTQTIKFRFPNSGGIQLSSPVVVNGVKRGSVTLVKNDKGSVFIEAIIDDVSDFQKDVSAKITTLEITGGKKIEIQLGTKGGNFNVAAEIPGATASDLSDLVTAGGELVKGANNLFLKLDTITTSVNKLLSKDKTITQLQMIVENTNEFIASAKNLLEQNRADINIALKNLKVISGDIREIVQKDDPKIDSLLSNLEKTLTTVRSTLNKADNSLANVDLIIKDIKDITKEIKSGDGIVSKMIFDKNTSVKLDSTLTNLSEFLSLIKNYGVNVNLRLGTSP